MRRSWSGREIPCAEHGWCFQKYLTEKLICDSFFTENYNKLFKLRALFELRGESDITNYLSVSLQSPVFMSQTFNVLSYEPLTTFSSSTWIKKCTQTCKMTIENDNWGTHCSSCVLRVLWKLSPNLSTGKKSKIIEMVGKASLDLSLHNQPSPEKWGQ